MGDVSRKTFLTMVPGAALCAAVFPSLRARARPTPGPDPILRYAWTPA